MLAITSLFITACAPVYDIKTVYTAPIATEGKECIQRCYREKENCKVKCNDKHHACLKKTKVIATKKYHHSMIKYEDLFSKFNVKTEVYNKKINVWNKIANRLKRESSHYSKECKKGKEKSLSCRKYEEKKSELREQEQLKPVKPKEPNKPNLEQSILDAQSSCSLHCACEEPYNSCYSVCGGKITYKKFCVENCKNDKK